MIMKPPRLMSTQHPDNVAVPDFARHEIFDAEDELVEARFCYETLGCDEQMWDAEGKVVDPEILLNLFTKHADYFSRHEIGKKLRLTYRLPNPRLEKGREEIITQMVGAIPRLTAEAKALNNNAHQPIFEIILPQTESAAEVINFRKKYCDPNLTVIPLFESITALIRSDEMVSKIIKQFAPVNQRVFLARSDPALSSGMLATCLAVKVALLRLDRLAKKTGVPIYPIIGVGSAPFRGHFTPATAMQVWKESAGASTLTVQSSFKYDYSITEVSNALTKLKNQAEQAPMNIPEQNVLTLISKLEKDYQSEIKKVIPLIKILAPQVPKRRQRFGHGAPGIYGRDLNGTMTAALPRAISFAATLYSAGLPPELFGLQNLTIKDTALLDEVYPSWRTDLSAGANYAHPNLTQGKKMLDTMDKFGIGPTAPSSDHHGVSTKILHSLEHTPTKPLTTLIFQAAQIRNFLG